MRNALLTSLLVLGLVAATTGCSRYYWSKPAATAQQFARDNQECLGHASSALPPGAAGDAVRQLYYGCLNRRGYVREKQVDPPEGLWYGRNGSTLEIRTAGGRQLYWERGPGTART